MEQTNKKRIQKIAEQILFLSSRELAFSMRFLTLAWGQFQYQMNLSTFYLGTDGEILYYQPRFLIEKYEYDSIFVNRSLLHMLFHCMFHHITRREERNLEDWNLACDIAVEYIIDGIDEACIKKLIPDRKEEYYRQLEKERKVITADNIYQSLIKWEEEKKLSYSQKEELKQLFLVDDHFFWEQKKKEERPQNEQREKQKELEQKWKEISDKIQTGLETFFKQIGTKNGTLLKTLKIENRQHTNYQEFLQKFAVVREELKIDMDSFDYGFYNYGIQLYGNLPLIEELEYCETKKIEDFVIALDTSGSCSGALIRRFLEETIQILKETEQFMKQVRIHIIQCDKEIKEDIVIHSLEQLKQYEQEFTVKGFGGTDFRPVFSYVQQLMKEEALQPKGLLYFTDGYGIYPEKKPPFKTAFLFIQEDYTDEKVPPWAIKVILDRNKFDI